MCNAPILRLPLLSMTGVSWATKEQRKLGYDLGIFPSCGDEEASAAHELEVKFRGFTRYISRWMNIGQGSSMWF